MTRACLSPKDIKDPTNADDAKEDSPKKSKLKSEKSKFGLVLAHPLLGVRLDFGFKSKLISFFSRAEVPLGLELEVTAHTFGQWCFEPILGLKQSSNLPHEQVETGELLHILNFALLALLLFLTKLGGVTIRSTCVLEMDAWTDREGRKMRKGEELKVMKPWLSQRLLRSRRRSEVNRDESVRMSSWSWQCWSCESHAHACFKGKETACADGLGSDKGLPYCCAKPVMPAVEATAE